MDEHVMDKLKPVPESKALARCVTNQTAWCIEWVGGVFPAERFTDDRIQAEKRHCVSEHAAACRHAEIARYAKRLLLGVDRLIKVVGERFGE